MVVDMEIAFSKQADINVEKWFTDDEVKEWEKLSSSKRLSRIVGRIAAKKAARQYFDSMGMADISYTDFTVQNTSSGMPMFFIRGALAKDVRISLSHSADVAMAMVDTDESGAFGIDIESIRDFDTETVENFLDENEFLEYQALLDVHERSDFATLRWSLKEACLKALGTGLREHPKSISVVRLTNGGYDLYCAGIRLGRGNEHTLPYADSDDTLVAV